MSSHTGHSFPHALKANLRAHIRGLPDAYRTLSWHRDEDGDQYAVIGPRDAAFLLCAGQHGSVTLTTAHGTCERLGTWAVTEVTGAAVVGLIADAVAREGLANDDQPGMAWAGLAFA
jgi:hypothetical protein